MAALSVLTTHIDALELRSYDFLMTVLRGPLSPPDDIVIVAIDESSMKEFAPRFSWPWPRSVHAELIRQLDRAGVRAIVFDVIFDLPSDPAEDAQFASAIRASHAPVVLAATVEDVQDQHFHMRQQIKPLPSLIDAGARLGFASIHPDVDGELRRAPLHVDGSSSLALAALEASGGHLHPHVVPVMARGSDQEFLINYAGGARTIRTVSYYQAIDAQHALPRGFLKGKTVLVGRSLSAQDISAGARSQDLFATPFDALMSGVEVHANALNTLARGQFIRRASPAVTWGLLALSGGVIALVMSAALRLRAKLLAAATLILFAPVLAAVTFVTGGYWLYTVQPVLVGTGVFMLNALYQYRVSEQERLFVRRALAGYVSKPVMQRLLDNPSALELGGVQVAATVLFSDIVGFSGIAERMTPHELVATLNAYFTRIGDVIMAHDGMIDKYIGDAIMAVWGAPLPDDRHEAKAAAAALAMKRAVAEGGGPLGARIGINTGPMMAGNLGHHERMEYTVIGDAVNLASRLEGANKLYGTAILVSEATMTGAAEEFIFRRVDRIRVVGKQEPVAVYELLASRTSDTANREEARARSFAAIVDAYDEHQWHRALDAVLRHRLLFPEEDSVVQLYEERCRRFELIPPPPEWDGVYLFTSK